MSEDFEGIRARFKPDQVRVLFVGESPPAGQTFFYNRNSNLYRYTRDAFASLSKQPYGAENNFLENFQRLGCYLDDLCLTPVNGLANPQRRSHRKAGQQALADRIKTYDPLAFVVVMKGIDQNIQKAISLAGYGRPTHYYVLDFPAMGHQDKYVRGLIEALKAIAQAGIIAV